MSINSHKLPQSRELPMPPERRMDIAARLNRLALAQTKMEVFAGSTRPEILPAQPVQAYASSMGAQAIVRSTSEQLTRDNWTEQQRLAADRLSLAASEAAVDSTAQRRDLQEGLGHGIPS